LGTGALAGGPLWPLCCVTLGWMVGGGLCTAGAQLMYGRLDGFSQQFMGAAGAEDVRRQDDCARGEANNPIHTVPSRAVYS